MSIQIVETAMEMADTSETVRPEPTNEELPVTIIRPVKRWELMGLGELWAFRELVAFLIWRDVKVRYKQTILGAAWAIIQPVSMMVVFSVFFNKLGGVTGGDVPYPVFVYAGLLPWTFFATAIASAGNSVVGSEKLITKIYFPRLAIPLASVGAAVVDFLIAFSLMLGIMAWYRVGISASFLMVPVFFATMLMLAVGVGALLASLNVAYRDFRYVIPFLVQMWMFATPSVYMRAGVGAHSEWVNVLLRANPMTALISGFRAACLGGPMEWQEIGTAVALSVVVLVVECLWFRRVEHTFADRI